MKLYRKGKHLIQLSVSIGNGKGLLIQLNNFNYPKGFTWFLQADKNIWWIPKHLKDGGVMKDVTYKQESVGWLFTQVGYIRMSE